MATIGPRIVQVLEFASARAPELQALHEIAHHAQMLTPADAKLDAQRNQRRRRANAFKSHKMPQRLRQKKAKQTQGEELIVLSTCGAPHVMQQHEAQPVDGAAKQQNAKSRARKHERRPHKLLAARSWQQQPTQRSDDNDAENKKNAVWLTTHLWHSKRMKMVEKYGVALAAHRADKSVSASLEALRSRATLQDQSYYGILELYGLPQLILEALQLVSDPAGSDFHGMRFLSGGEEGQSVLYHEGQFPSGAICPVSFMWRPLQADSRRAGDIADDSNKKFELHADWQETKRQLWLWVHPAAFMEAASAIASACQSILEDSDDEIQVIDRRGQLCRFKLRGALADDFLEQVCKDEQQEFSVGGLMRELDAESDHEDGFETVQTAEQCASTNLALLMKRLSAKKKRESNKKSNKSIAEPSSGSASTESALYSVVVSDPRVRLHKQHLASKNASSDELSLLREPTQSDIASASDGIKCPVSSEPLTKPGNKDAEEPESELILQKLSAILRWTRTPNAAPSVGKALAKYPFTSPLDGKQSSIDGDVDMADGATLVPCSFLWSRSKRQQLSKTFQKDHIVNDKCFTARQDRSQRLAQASTALHLIAVEKLGPFPSTSGWDLILPPSFAPSLLKTFVYAGALVVGLDEDEALDTVLQRPSFPRDFPDTLAGESYWKAEADAQQITYLKKPKAKRFSYEKHSIASPFQPDWKFLFSTAAADDGADDEAVRGEAQKDAGGSDEDEEAPSSPCVLRGEGYMTPFCFYEPTEASVAKIPVAVPTLVRVVLRVPGRASLAPNAMLYMPTANDVKHFYAQKSWNGCEITDFKSPERSLVGFVTSAVYDRPKGAFRALGFCACEPLQDVFLQQRELIKSREALVMLRTPHSKMYRPVFIRAEA